MKYLIKTITVLMIATSSLIYAAISNENENSSGNNFENQYVISNIGLNGVIEIGMVLKDLQKKGVHYDEKEKDPDFIAELGRHYKIESLGVEFLIMESQIIRIWFFSKKYIKSPVQFVLSDKPKILSSISADDIISSFGRVDVFLKENPKKSDAPYWVKYDPFKVGINYIVYPDSPYLFYLDSTDMLSSITVSSEYD